MTSTVNGLPFTLYSFTPSFEMSMVSPSTVLYCVILVDNSKILLVTPSGAGPPFSQLNLMPKSLSGPPGLCEAVNKIPPSALLRRIKLETAGVDRMPFWPTSNFDTSLAAQMRTMSSAASLQKYRPSPPTTKVEPASAPSFESRIHWMKFSV